MIGNWLFNYRAKARAQKDLSVLRAIQLSALQKDTMRQSLLRYVQNAPVRNFPLSRQIYQYAQGFGPFFTHKYHYMIASLIIAALLAISGGTTVAAEGALPGETLYPVKVHINETLRSALAVSAHAQADWDITRVQRRLAEAAALEVRGELSATNQAELQAQIATIIAHLNEEAAKLSAEDNSEARAAVYSRLEAVLAAHAELLTALAEHKDVALSPALAAELTKLTARLGTAAQLRTEAETAVTASAAVRVQAAAEGKITAAEQKIAEVKKLFDRKKDQLTEATAAAVSVKLTNATGALAIAQTELSAQAYTRAFLSAQQSMRYAQEAQRVINGSVELENHIRIQAEWSDNDEDDEGANSDETARNSDADNDDEDEKDRINENGQRSTNASASVEARAEIEARLKALAELRDSLREEHEAWVEAGNEDDSDRSEGSSGEDTESEGDDDDDSITSDLRLDLELGR